MSLVTDLIKQQNFSKADILHLLKSEGEDRTSLFQAASQCKERRLGNKVYYRGLLEFSNICAKNCFYCGIRRGNKEVDRYFLPENEILEAVGFAYEQKYGSLVIQAGERSDKWFVDRISSLLEKIQTRTNGEMGITLSLGEQAPETYQRWYELGAERYLIRIETSDRDLYEKLHPNDKLHSFENRLKALDNIRQQNFQTGTGIMIGLPFQTMEHLANDLLFFRGLDVDMVGMGPYIEHEQTPLFEYRDQLLPKEERFDLTLKMISILRLMMPDINIAATTAMQAIDKLGREKAIKTGANVLMPNITPVQYREGYLLYEDKPCLDENASECKTCLEARVHLAGNVVAYGEKGTPVHYVKRQK